MKIVIVLVILTVIQYILNLGIILYYSKNIKQDLKDTHIIIWVPILGLGAVIFALIVTFWQELWLKLFKIFKC